MVSLRFLVIIATLCAGQMVAASSSQNARRFGNPVQVRAPQPSKHHHHHHFHDPDSETAKKRGPEPTPNVPRAPEPQMDHYEREVSGQSWKRHASPVEKRAPAPHPSKHHHHILAREPSPVEMRAPAPHPSKHHHFLAHEPRSVEKRAPAPLPSGVRRRDPSLAREPTPVEKRDFIDPLPSGLRRRNPSLAREPTPVEKRAPAPHRSHHPHAQRAGNTSAKRYDASYPDVSKRDMAEQEILGALTEACPMTLFACPVIGTKEFECVDFTADLTSCGGCGSYDISHDCTAIPNSLGVACVVGTCQVQTCMTGFAVASDDSSCVPV